MIRETPSVPSTEDLTGDLFRSLPVKQLDVAAISHVFTLKHVAEKLGEDEEWLWDLQINLEPDGCL